MPPSNGETAAKCEAILEQLNQPGGVLVLLQKASEKVKSKENGDSEDMEIDSANKEAEGDAEV